MHPEASLRYASVKDLVADLSRWRQSQSVRAYRENIFEQFIGALLKYRLPIALVSAYVVMRVLLLLVGR